MEYDIFFDMRPRQHSAYLRKAERLLSVREDHLLHVTYRDLPGRVVPGKEREIAEKWFVWEQLSEGEIENRLTRDGLQSFLLDHPDYALHEEQERLQAEQVNEDYDRIKVERFFEHIESLPEDVETLLKRALLISANAMLHAWKAVVRAATDESVAPYFRGELAKRTAAERKEMDMDAGDISNPGIQEPATIYHFDRIGSSMLAMKSAAQTSTVAEDAAVWAYVPDSVDTQSDLKSAIEPITKIMGEYIYAVYRIDGGIREKRKQELKNAA
jgi:hypothetical protein